ncbi:MAG: hypothetical protein FWF96_00350 [Kiritimatiellaeota bacterium]|nr:hypothetical protein [Kiritimatiellota bacterium]
MNLLVTAGPTREMLDPVRFFSNRSTGKMGFAVASVAACHGHNVRLIAGPVALATPEGVERIDVISARDMLAAVEKNLDGCDALVMTAAVADWRPCHENAQKLKKGTMSPVIELEPNPDILKTIAPRKGKKIFVGFAAETENLLAEAQRKLVEKKLDLLVANDVSCHDSGFEVETNRVIFFTPGNPPEHLPLMRKSEVAERIVEWLGRRPS